MVQFLYYGAIKGGIDVLAPESMVGFARNTGTVQFSQQNPPTMATSTKGIVTKNVHWGMGSSMGELYTCLLSFDQDFI